MIRKFKAEPAASARAGAGQAPPAPSMPAGEPDHEWLQLLQRARAGGEAAGDAVCDAYSWGIRVGVERVTPPPPSQGEDMPGEQLDALVAALPEPTTGVSPYVRDLMRSMGRSGYRLGYAAALGYEITISDGRVGVGDRAESPQRDDPPAVDVEQLLASTRAALAAAVNDQDRETAVEELLEAWYGAWPPSALTSPHEAIAGELVRLLCPPPIAQDALRASAPLREWCIVELMGHRRLAGQVQEVQLAGAGFLRLDIPAVDGDPGRSQFLAPGSVYALHPVDEATGRRAATVFRPEPVQRWQVTATPASTPAAAEFDDDDPRGWQG